MKQSPVIVRHSGRRTVASGRCNEQQLKAFRNALLSEEFFVVSEGDNTLELGRKIRLLEGDWPMRVLVNHNGGAWQISYYMFIPWNWIFLFGLMVLVFLPFAAFQGAPVAFALGLGIMAAASYKQKFDLSPDAFWQGPPRKRWDRIMRQRMLDCFGGNGST